MAPKFGKVSPTKSKQPLRSAGQISLTTDVGSAGGATPKSPLSQLYEQKPFGFSPSSPRSLVARQAVAGLSQDARVQEMSNFVASRGGASLPVLVPEEPVAAVDSMAMMTQSSSLAIQHVRTQKSMAPSPSGPELRTGESFGLLPAELTGYSFRATTGEFLPAKGRRQSNAGAGYRTGLHSSLPGEDGHPLRPSGDRPSTRETVAALRAEGLNVAEQQSRRLAKLTPVDSLEDIRGVRRTPALPKNNSLPNLRKHDTEAARVYDQEVDRWLRRLMVDVNISHKSLPESSAQSQICTHLDKVHGWFDRSKRVATDLKESAGEKSPFGPSQKQAGIYLPSGSPAPPGSLHWERPEKPIKLSKSDAASTNISDVTTDPGDITDSEGMAEPLDIACP